jgi:flagellar biosynthesis protein FlhF
MIAPLRAELRSLRSMVRSGRVTAAEAPASAPPSGAPSVAASAKRIVVVVGPTGVGKTTTIAKLAARAALVERRRVAVITVDDYRVGAADQLRTFTNLIGIPLRVSEPGALRAQLAATRDADRIYVDTAGRSPRDREALWSLEHALGGLDDVEVHLAIAAATSPALIDDCARRHRALGVARLLFTKLDEALDLGELIRAPRRLGLPVTWVTTGQRVPEDLEDATAERLAAHVARAAAEVAA